MIYKDPKSYKAYHLFLIQNLCIHADVGCKELEMADKLVLSSLLLFSCACYYVDLDDI